jgi:FSR family fosmidomycin resistance protein-like MFS transporter
MGGLKGALVAFLPTYLTEKGYSLAVAGISLSVLEAGGVVGVLTAGILSDKLGRKSILFVIGIAVPVLMWLFLLSPGILTLPILGILGFFLFSTGPIMLAIVQESDSERPAYVNGIYMMLNFVIGSAMTIIIGVLNDWVGLEITYHISIWWFFGAIPCLFFLPGKFFPRKI